MGVLLVLVGVRGAGKSTVIEGLRGQDDLIILQPSTTRPARPNETEYDFSNPDIWNADPKVWSIQVGQFRYGMRKSELAAIKSGTGLTVFDPGNIDVINDLRSSLGHEVITVGLDTVRDLDEASARVGHDPLRTMNQNDFDEQQRVVRNCDVVLSGDQATVLAAVRALVRTCGGRGGILDEQTIRDLMAAGALLTDCDPNNISYASYDLRLGDQAWCQGKFIPLSEQQPALQIPPYSYALVSARETARLPNFVAARFDIKVSLFFQGVVLSNGPQVDPGYEGALFCMLYNGSDAHVGIKRGYHFSTIEFATLSRRTKGYQSQHQRKFNLYDFIPGHAAVGSGGKILERLNEQMSQLRTDWTSVRALSVAVVAVVLSTAGLTGALAWNALSDVKQKAAQLDTTLAAAERTLENYEKKVARLDELVTKLSQKLNVEKMASHGQGRSGNDAGTVVKSISKTRRASTAPSASAVH